MAFVVYGGLEHDETIYALWMLVKAGIPLFTQFFPGYKYKYSSTF